MKGGVPKGTILEHFRVPSWQVRGMFMKLESAFPVTRRFWVNAHVSTFCCCVRFDSRVSGCLWSSPKRSWVFKRCGLSQSR